VNEAIQRAEIKRYVRKAFPAKILHMNDERARLKTDAKVKLTHSGHSLSSSAWMIREMEIEEDCLAALVHQHADLYLNAYERKGIKIGPEVLTDIEYEHNQITAGRQSALIGQANLLATRTNRQQNPAAYAHIGHKSSVALREVEAKIALYNLTPKKEESMTINNINYHLVNSRVTHGDDNSVNIINEKELFDGLATAITSNVQDVTERQSILDKLGELKAEKSKTGFITRLASFVTSAGSIAHVIEPYLPALTDKLHSLI
jgi:hypothetical protein